MADYNDLSHAVRKNDVLLVKQLVKQMIARGHHVIEYAPALFDAAERGFVKCAKVLLDANADVNTAVADLELTPLHYASRRGHAECVKLLIDWKANVNAKTDDGDSPLQYAAWQGHLVCVEMLIRAGVELDACNNNGYTPLAQAINFNKPGVAELLLDKGAKMSNVHEGVEIPNWMNVILTKRESVKRSLTSFIGVLRKRFAISGGGTEYTRGRLPRDVVGMISRWAWTTRFDKRWEGAGVPETVKKLKL